MLEHPDSDPAEHGAVPLDMIQRYINYWVSSSNDLYGSEVSSNAAKYFASGIKGRAWEEKRYEDHVALEGSYEIERVEDGRLVKEEVPLRNAMNEVLRSEYTVDNQKGIDYWNRIVARHDLDFEFRLPSRRFRREIGLHAGFHFDLEGGLVDEAAFENGCPSWIPTQEDRDHVESLMEPCLEHGKIAGWIAPPAKGIQGQPFEFDYVRL